MNAQTSPSWLIQQRPEFKPSRPLIVMEGKAIFSERSVYPTYHIGNTVNVRLPVRFQNDYGFTPMPEWYRVKLEQG